MSRHNGSYKNGNGSHKFDLNDFWHQLNQGFASQNIMDAYQRNMEAYRKIGQLSIDCSQALLRCNLDHFKNGLQETTAAFQALTAQKSPKGKAQIQSHLLHGAVERTQAALKDTTQILQRSNQEAFALLQGQLQANLAQAQDTAPRSIRKSSKR